MRVAQCSKRIGGVLGTANNVTMFYGLKKQIQIKIDIKMKQWLCWLESRHLRLFRFTAFFVSNAIHPSHRHFIYFLFTIKIHFIDSSSFFFFLSNIILSVSCYFCHLSLFQWKGKKMFRMNRKVSKLRSSFHERKAKSLQGILHCFCHIEYIK